MTDKFLIVTDGFLKVLAHAQRLLEQQAITLESSPEYAGDNAVGVIIRGEVETSLQDSALLADIVERFSKSKPRNGNYVFRTTEQNAVVTIKDDYQRVVNLLHAAKKYIPTGSSDLLHMINKEFNIEL